MRIYELAKKLGVKSNSILSELSKLGIEGKRHSSNIESTLAKQLEETLFKGNIDRKEFDEKEGLQEFKKISKERLSEYKKYKISIRTPEYVNLWDNDNGKERILHGEEIEKPILIKDEDLKPDPQTVSIQINDMDAEKREDYKDRRAIIAVLILSAIFIIGVMFITVINYYVWRDRTYEIPETKSLDLPVQKQYRAQLFTIQAGAFNDAYFAKSLMSRLSKKGYPAFITTSYLKEKKLYKVFIGKFTERLDAEEMSLKIKKAEGIQTFVTFWDKNYLQDSEPTSYKTPSYHPI